MEADSGSQAAIPQINHENSAADAPAALTLADVAHIIFPHLASGMANDECALASLCQSIALTDLAGCYGPPGVAHDTLLNAIWASVAAEVPPEAGVTTLPSLYDNLRESGGYAPFRLLKVRRDRFSPFFHLSSH